MNKDMCAYPHPTQGLEPTQQSHTPQHSHAADQNVVHLLTHDVLRFLRLFVTQRELTTTDVWACYEHAWKRRMLDNVAVQGNQSLPPRISDHTISRGFVRKQTLERSSSEPALWVEVGQKVERKAMGLCNTKSHQNKQLWNQEKAIPSTGVHRWATSALVHLTYRINTAFRVTVPQKDLDSISTAVARALNCQLENHLPK